MTVTFTEHTPGVRAGEWRNPRDGTYRAVVAIQSIDGWTAYIGDQCIGTGFKTYDAATSFAVAKLDRSVSRRGATAKWVLVAAGVAGVAIIAFAVHRYAGTSSPFAAAVGQSGSAKIEPANGVGSVATRGGQVLETGAIRPAATGEADGSAAPRFTVDLPAIDPSKADPAPWIDKPPQAGADETEDIVLPAKEDREIIARWVESDDAEEVPDAVSDAVSDAVPDAALKTPKERKRSDAQASGDVDASEAEVEATAATTSSAPVIRQPATAKASVRGDLDKRAERRAARQAKLRRAKARRQAKARLAKKRNRDPLIRRIVRRDYYGQRQVVYRVRRPRSRSEYQQLQRLRRKIIAERRRRGSYRY